MAAFKLKKIPKPVWYGIGGFLGAWGVVILSTVLASQVVIARFLLDISPKSYLTGTNILILGLDADKDIQRSDTIMVLHLGKKKQIKVVSVPRDTRVQLPGVRGHTKINHAYARGKARLAVEAVSHTLGVPIHHYIILRLEGVASIVDSLGGISLTLSKPMHYVDHAGHLFIDLQAGQQTLNGNQALQYLRFRHDPKGDIGRIERQQAFLQALKSKLSSVMTLIKLPSLMVQLYRHVETDMSFSQVLGMAFQLQTSLDGGKVESLTLPGEALDINGASYWVVDPEKSRQALFSFELDTPSVMTPSSPASTVPASVSNSQGEELLPDEDYRGKSSLNLKLEILCSPDQRISQALLTLLKTKGVTLSRNGSTGTDTYQQTMIVDWKGNVDVVLGLARLLSIDPSQIIVYDRPEKHCDATLILGQDWPKIEAELQLKNRLD